MTGQIAASGSLPLELVAALVVVAMLLGAVDIIRQPGWAWKQAEESQLAYLILDLLLPVIGLGLYAFRARPKVTALVTAGPAPDRPPGGASGTGNQEADRPEPAVTSVTAIAPVSPADPARPAAGPAAGPAARPTTNPGPNRFTSFREMTDSEPGDGSGDGSGSGSGETVPDPEQPEVFEISSTFFSTGAATRTVRHPLALARAYRPRQRTSLSESEDGSGSEVGSESGSEVGSESGSEVRVEIAARATAEPNVEARSTAAAAAELELVREPEPVTDVLTVPSGWKVDPSGRHQFRYWDGYHWTENVADDGAESRDAVSA